MKIKVSENVYKIIDSAGNVKYVDKAGNPVNYQEPAGDTVQHQGQDTQQPQQPQPQSQPQPQPQQPQYQQEPMMGEKQTFRFGFHATPFRRLGAGEHVLSEFTNTLKEIYKAADITDIKVVPLDKNTFGTAMSIVAVVKIDNSVATCYLLALEATSDNLKGVRLETINPQAYFSPQPNRKPERFIVPTDVFDNVLYGIVDTAIRDTFRVQAVNISGGVLVPEFMEPTKDRCIGVAEVALEAVMIRSMPDTTDIEINIGKEIRSLDRSEQLVYRLDIGNSTLFDETTMPKRQSFMVSLNLRSNVREQSINIVNSERTIVKTSGFVDVVPIKQAVGGMQGMVPATITRFHPHVVIDYMYNTYTDGYLLLNLASGLIVRNNNAWLECLKPNRDDKLHDPGALNILANIENNPSGSGERVDFFAAGLSEYDIYNTLQRFFMDGVFFSVDVDLFSAPSWAYSGLLGAVYEADNQSLMRLIQHANILTDSNFQKYFDPARNRVATKITRIPRGFWTDANGMRRDLREIDVIAILNETDDFGKANEFIGAYLSGADENPMLFPSLLETYRRIIPQGAVVTGWTIRITFSSEFMLALEHGLRDAGFGATIEGATMMPFAQQMVDASTFFQNAAVTGQSTLVNQPAFGFTGQYGKFAR